MDHYDFRSYIRYSKFYWLIVILLSLFLLRLSGVLVVLLMYGQIFAVIVGIILAYILVSFVFKGDCNNVGVISLIEMINQDTNSNIAYVFYKGSVRTNYKKVIDVNRQLHLKTEINKKNILHNIQIVKNRIGQ